MKQKDFNHHFANLVRSQNPKTPIELMAQIKTGTKLTKSRALEVYQEDYQARLTETLKNTFRAINYVIGDEDFAHLASDYIKIFPSQSSDLDDYGNNFSVFLTTHLILRDYLFLSELAHFEWNFREVFHQEQIFGLDSLALIELLKEISSTVQLVNSVRLLHYNYSLTNIYALKDIEVHDESDFNFQIPEYLLMYKIDFVVKTYVLSKYQWEILKLLTIPNSLLKILQDNSDEVAPEEVKSLFSILGINKLLSPIV